jgi:hypothetical protein
MTQKHFFFLFSFILFIGSSAFAKSLEISNDYIKATVDYDTGSFALETIEGDLGMPYDNNKSLLYKKLPPTTITTISIDNQIYVFGSEDGNFKKKPYSDGKKISCEWIVNDVSVVQEISLAEGPSTGLPDNMLLSYRIANKYQDKTVKVGIRVFLDIVLGDKKPRAFGIPGKGNVASETQFYRENVPPFWFCFDNYDNPTIRVQGTLVGYGATRPDKIIFASWDRLYDNPWDFSIDSSKDFKRGGSSTYDSAVALYFDPISIGKGQSAYFSTLYGVYGTSFFTDRDMLLSLSVPKEIKGVPIPVSANFVNQAKKPLDRLKFELLLPKGFKLEEGQSNIIEFVKIETNVSKMAIWNLTSGTVKGNFDIKVRATGWQDNYSNSIEANQSFGIDFVENLGVPVPTNTNAVNTAAPVLKPVESQKNKVLNVISTLPKEKKIVPLRSEKEKALQKQIDELDKQIEGINKKYQIWMEIYKNTYITNVLFINDLGKDLTRLEEELKKQEAELNRQKLDEREE